MTFSPFDRRLLEEGLAYFARARGADAGWDRRGREETRRRRPSAAAERRAERRRRT